MLLVSVAILVLQALGQIRDVARLPRQQKCGGYDCRVGHICVGAALLWSLLPRPRIDLLDTATSFSFLLLPPLLLRHSENQALDMVSCLGIWVSLITRAHLALYWPVIT